MAKHLGVGEKGEKTAQELYRQIEAGWLDWAGPPDSFVADSERGFASEYLAEMLGRAGTHLLYSASYAPWQKGKVERRIQTFENIVEKIRIHQGIRTDQDMRFAGIEAINAMNQRPLRST